jgi:hypothetical protein
VAWLEGLILADGLCPTNDLRGYLIETVEPDKAEILGYLAAEGNEYHYSKTRWRFYPDRGRSGRCYLIHYRQDGIEFTNLDLKIQQRFQQLLTNVYGPQNIRFGSRWRIRIRQKHIVADLLGYSRLGCLDWTVPKAVNNSEDHVRAAWCRGYADGEGSVAKTQIELPSVNRNGLDQVQGLLQSLGISSTIGGPYSHKPHLDSFRLWIHKRFLSDYARLIGFNHPRKNFLLNQILNKSPVVRA